jgi:S-adenosyl-L-methionine hydrolase (adenosine-forming)
MHLTLLSDFGLTDGYVGMMKGVIAQIAPHLVVIDLTHQIPPQDIAAARFQLMVAYPYFPPGTVHVAVVDPGVGGTRRAIALQLAQGWLVGPDNGLFSGILTQQAVLTAIELTNPHYWRCPTPSATFHGRDIFAPVGAHLANGVPLANLGRPIAPSTLVTLDLPPLTPIPGDYSGQLQGCIQAIDHFGNLITNIPGHLVSGRSWQIQVGNTRYPHHTTYAEGEPGAIIALIGSHGWVEIAVNQGSAHQQLAMGWGSAVTLIAEDR